MYPKLGGSRHRSSQEQLREADEQEAQPNPADFSLDARIGPGFSVRVDPECSLKGHADRLPRSARLSSRPHLPSNGERRGEDVQKAISDHCASAQDEDDADGCVHAYTVDHATMR